jgi:xanthine dehydrogenase large subunit
MKTMRVNGRAVDISAIHSNENLLGVLRSNGLTGTKCGCAEGDCGACSVVILDDKGNPRSINSCLALVNSLEGREVYTSEGFAKDGKLHPVQEAMVSCYGSQCGYCTPGFIASMVEGYHRDGKLDRTEIADQLCGNLCRCTGYRAIRDAMEVAQEGKVTSDFDAVKIDGPPEKWMTSMPASDGEYFSPRSLEELLELKAVHPEAVLVAGATELAVVINKRHLRYPKLIGLENVPELKEIRSNQDEWWIGAGATLTNVADSIRGEYPAFDKMISVFASRQIRHRATLGGNLVTASPIGDSAPVLLALDASVRLVSREGERTVPLDQFFTGYRKTVMQSDEVMIAVTIPRAASGRMEFFKVSKRREMDISIVSSAIRIAEENGIVTEARLAFGGVAAIPLRAKNAEAALLGKPLAIDDAFLALLESEFTPMSDVRGSADFRKAVIRGMFEKFVKEERSASIDGDPGFGDSIPMRDGLLRHESASGHVTGAASYVFDQALKRGMLDAWPVCSKVARGRITRLDFSEARAMSGVSAILSAADVPGLNNVGPSRHDEPLFAEEEVFYKGQLIALVIGGSEEECRLAAEKVIVEYETEKPLLGIKEAIAEGSYHTDPHVLERGDVEAGLSNAPHVIEDEIFIGGQEHFYLETHACWAECDGEGGYRVVSSTQHPSEVQAIIAEVLDVTKNLVVVESPRMGGGFGGKETQGNCWAAACALGAKITGRGVRIQLDRDIDMMFTGKRHPFHAGFKVGFDDSGKLLAAKVDVTSDGGWALDLSQPVTDRALFHLDNSYFIPAVRFSGIVARTNTVSHTAFRGFGGPQGMVIIEEIVGRIAARLGLPAEEVRRRNFYGESGEENLTHYGAPVGEVRIKRIWRELLQTSEFAERRREIDRFNGSSKMIKRGLAVTPVKFGISFTLKSYNQAGALVLIYQDGSVQVNHGGTEMGQGLHTKILAVGMKELGVPREALRLMNTRTDKVPNTSATAASSGSDLNGMAVADACRQLRGRLSAVAAEVTDGNAEDTVFSEGMVSCGGQTMTFGELAKIAYLRRVQLSAAGFYRTPDLEWDWNVGKGRPFFYYAWGGAVSEVEIDGYTGMNKVLRTDILHDVGDSLNGNVDRGQIEGAFVQGMGWLTREELKWNNEGTLLSHSASTYAIPAFSDAPVDFRVELLRDAAQPGTIHGSKAVGEPPFMLGISVREALRDAVKAFGFEKDFTLPSPCTGEALKLLVDQVKAIP